MDSRKILNRLHKKKKQLSEKRKQKCNAESFCNHTCLQCRKLSKRCLDSVCNQTLSDIETICINDCSTDNSLNILKEYNVKIVNLEENKGASFARNIGIEKACGEYLGFVDSDDYISADFYEILYNNSKRADIVKGNIIDADTKSNYTVL